MKLTDHLDRIYQLVLDRADPAKVRGHIELIRDQVEAVAKIEAQLRKEIARKDKLHAKEVAQMAKVHADEISKLTQSYAAYKQIVETFGITPKQLLPLIQEERRRRGLQIKLEDIYKKAGK